jgi:hypothetical protein
VNNEFFDIFHTQCNMHILSAIYNETTIKGRKMTVDFNLLDPEFSKDVQELLETCEKDGYKFIPIQGLRDLETQAKLWRQSRHATEIAAEMRHLKNLGCDYLASIIDKVGPQPMARWATNTIPGLSWHNWGKALDVVYTDPRLTKIEYIWDGAHPAYGYLKEKAVMSGKLITGYSWAHKDSGHIQVNSSSVNNVLTLKEINDHFEAKNDKI